MKNSILLFLCIILLSIACKQPENTISPLAHIKDNKIKTILTQAMETTGGLDNWINKKSIQFKKYFALYDEQGNTEQAVYQKHIYQSYPNKSIHISWEKDSLMHEIKRKEGKITKFVNGQIDTTANPTSLKNTVLSATFVTNIPFNLLDKGVELSYDGSDVLEKNEAVEVIKAVYNPEKHDNHSTPDIWWYYFNKKDSRLVAYMVKHADHYSYVKNLSYLEKDGFLFCGKRQSFRVDSERNILYLRAEYEYSDFVVKM